MRPSRDHTLMAIATAVSERSTCNRAHVGAVISRGSRVISTGYNGSPSGMDHCPSPEEPGCTRTVHAETNAIVFAARYGISTDGCTLYTTVSPCVECAKLIINAGIVRVVYKEPYRLTDGIELLKMTDVEVDRYDSGDGTP